MSDPEALESAVESAHEFGGLDVMVNNAAVQHVEDFLSLSPEDLDKLYEVNIRGMFFGTQIAAQDMLDRDDPGSVVNIASISSEDAQHGQVQYDARKGAIEMITRGAAHGLADQGIRVNAVAPGQIATEFKEGWSEEAQEKAGGGGEEKGFIKPIPLGRAGVPEDCADASLFLAS